ncbi:hypothetical protein, partial [Zoogloea sp.]|uniref:hypothetical protein n=1 Tax=Zoogloea sp. TaxID=49181 RepID=UPI00260590D2
YRVSKPCQAISKSFLGKPKKQPQNHLRSASSNLFKPTPLSTSPNLLRHFFFSENVSACSERAAQYKHPQKNVNTFEETFGGTLLTKNVRLTMNT